MEFTLMRDNLIKHFTEMTKNVTMLFEVNLDKDALWNLYLDSFPVGANEIFRERRELDCNACRDFVKHFGNVVKINGTEIETIWNFDTGVPKYQPAINALDEYVKKHEVTNVYVAKERRVGIAENFETIENGKIYAWTHFYVDIPNNLINRQRESVGEIQGMYRDCKNTFKRALDEITKDSVETLLELISTNSLYRGKEWKNILTKFAEYQNEYETISTESRNNYTWVKSIEAGISVAKIRNSSIGTLLVNLSEGMDLDMAVRKYEEITAPENYKRSSTIFTKKMLEDAKKTLTEDGYMDSLQRRFAKVDDITVNNILYCNRNVANRIGTEPDIFGELEKETKNNARKFDRVEEVGIEKFISDVLPTAKEIELYLENKHSANMVSLIAPQNPESKNMFKWDNNFSWAYAGNVTDSMKERVKKAGGKVDGDLRFSIQWNDGVEHDGSDLDAHCIEPNGYELCFRTAKKPRFSPTRGQLDVDIINPVRNTAAVENIAWANRNTMTPGTYKFQVHCYTKREKQAGFSAEVEFDGQIYSFEYTRPLMSNQTIDVASITLDDKGNFTIKPLLPTTASSKNIWGLNTNQFIPVSAIMYSPNWWDNQKGIGNQHVFFMLDGCVNNEQPNSFFNEYLKQELYQKHRKVLEALGSKLPVAASDDQLSGVGFCMTKRAEVVVKVKGSAERILKIKF